MAISTPMTPITNKEDFLSGENQILAPIIQLTPVKMSLMENVNGYVIEDSEGNIFCVSFMAVSRLGWDKLNLPESDAYKTHLKNKVAKYGKQIVNL